MITVKDIAKIIATRYSLSNVEAEIFMQMIVEVINDGLLHDRQVKIKGFGTFKLQTVKERSSVNVNTGEKVLIAEHDKVSFVPDAVMKDLVNKPFAQFETVIVEDNSPLLSDATVPEEVLTENKAPKNYHLQTETNETVTRNKAEDKNTDEEVTTVDTIQSTPVPSAGVPGNNEDKNQLTSSVIQEEQEVKTDTTEDDKESILQADTVAKEQKTNTGKDESDTDGHDAVSTEQDECGRPLQRCRNIFIYYGILINIVVAILAFIAGYMASHYGVFSEETKEEVTRNVRKQAPMKKPAKKVIIKDTIHSPAPQTVERQEEETVKKEVEKKNNENNSGELDFHKYDDDIRVRTGAYYITGTDKEVTVKEGQTLESISRQHLGEGMECYVEVYNGIKNVKKGDVIKIPTLKLKKKKH